MSLASQPATRAGGPRPDDSDEEDDGPPGDLYQPSHFQDTQCGDLAQPSHFGTGETLAELSARMSQLESVSRRNTRGSMESAASMRSGPTTASTMRAAAMRAAAKKKSNPPTPKPPTPPPELPPEPPTPAPPAGLGDACRRLAENTFVGYAADGLPVAGSLDAFAVASNLCL